MENSGIYKITNILNDKCYIGSSTNLKKRLNRHLNLLKNNKHFSIYLQNSWNKYGEKNFTFEVIEYCNPKNCVKKEQYYLDTLKPAYNTKPIANSNFGCKFSEKAKENMSKAMSGTGNNFYGKSHKPEAKEKMRKAKLGKKLPKEQIDKMNIKKQIKIYKYSLQGKLLNIFNSIKETKKDMGVTGNSYSFDNIVIKGYYYSRSPKSVMEIINFVKK